jgi:hypothetical protein
LGADNVQTHTLQPQPLSKKGFNAGAIFPARPTHIGCYGNPRSVQRPAIPVVIVSPIRIDSAWLAQWSTTHTANRWDGVDQWKQLCDVVAIRARQDDRERRAVDVSGDEWSLRCAFPVLCRAEPLECGLRTST